MSAQSNTPGSTARAGASSAPPSVRDALIAAALLGVLADPLLRNPPWGLGLLVWLVAFALAVWLVTRRMGRTLPSESLLWLGLAVASGAGLSWRDADTILVFDVFAMLVALTLLSMSLNGKPVANLALARLRDLVRGAFGTAVSVATGAVPLVGQRLEEMRVAAASRASGAPGTANTSRRGLRLGLALIVAIVLVLIFTLMLRNADPLFKAYVSFPDIQTDVIFSHVAISVVFAWIVGGWVKRALYSDTTTARNYDGTDLNSDDTDNGNDELPIALGAIEIGVVLGALTLLFIVFVAVQVGWLFGGAGLVVRTTGLTYAEYARQGFFELTAVAALVLAVLLGVHAFIRRADGGTLTLFRRLAGVLVLLTAAIIVSAAARMHLYVHYYGWSVDRLYACAIMAWVAVVFAWLVVTVLRGRGRSFAVGVVAAAYAVLLALNVLNPDALVTRTNLARAELSRADSALAGADPKYLANLGGDAVPVLVPALMTPDIAQRISTPAERCAAAKVLLKRWTGSAHERDVAHWTQWNVARARADRIIAAQLPALRALADCPTP